MSEAHHDSSECARVWQMLRMAHDRVEKRLTTEFATLGLTISEFDVMLYLHARSGDAARIGAILESVSLSQPAMSRLVARLEERDFLIRTGTENDGRAINVCLTISGEDLICRAIEMHAQVIHKFLDSRFSSSEQAMLLEGLSRITR